jgi:hypothetical protein
MAAIMEQVTGMLKRTWECKQCHESVGEEHTIAYHLIDGILYGWCDSCFSQRASTNPAVAESAA